MTCLVLCICKTKTAKFPVTLLKHWVLKQVDKTVLVGSLVLLLQWFCSGSNCASISSLQRNLLYIYALLVIYSDQLELL